jgi:hypothetical protein
MGGQKTLFCRKIMEACEAKEHGHDKETTSSGRTNNARKGVDERVWAVQLVDHAGTKVTK